MGLLMSIRDWVGSYMKMSKAKDHLHKPLLMQVPKELQSSKGTPQMTFGWQFKQIPIENYWDMRVSRDLGLLLDGGWVAYVALAIAIVALFV